MNKMQISVNGNIITTEAKSLHELLIELNYTKDWLASAVNSQVIKKSDRKDYLLQDGDKIEILSPMQGG